MKNIIQKTLWIALIIAVCSGTACTEDTAGLGPLPAVSEELFTITPDPENSGLIHFDFYGTKMQPFWEVQRSKTSYHTTNSPHFSLTYQSGTYDGTLTVYGHNGISEAWPFTFTVETTEVVGSENEKILMSTPWCISNLGYLRNGNESSIVLDDFPFIFDDVLTFNADHSVAMDLGTTPQVYYDRAKPDGWMDPVPTGMENWELFESEEDESIILQFGNGGFPLALSDHRGINGSYVIDAISADHIRLLFQRNMDDPNYFFVIDLKPLASANEEIFVSTPWRISGFGWNGEGWEYYDDPLPAGAKDDVLIFASDHSFVLDQGDDKSIYHDKITDYNGTFTPSGDEKWALVEEDGRLFLELSGGAFPGMYGNDDAIDGGRYAVTEISAEKIRIEYDQLDGQNFVIFLAPYTQPERPDNPADPSLLESYAETLRSHDWIITRYRQFEASGENGEWQQTPESALDDVLTFLPDGAFAFDPGSDARIYNDEKGDYQQIAITGSEKWTLVEKDGRICIRFSEGGFPGILADDAAVDGLYLIREISGTDIRLDYTKAGSRGLSICLAAEDLATEKALLAAHDWKPSAASYLSSKSKDDVITFQTNGRFLLDQGKNTAIYNDENSKQPSIESTGEEMWELFKLQKKLWIRFSGGGLAFPSEMGDDWANNAEWLIPILTENSARFEYQKKEKTEADGSPKWFFIEFVPAE